MTKANFTLKSLWQYGLGLMLLLALPFWGTAQTFVGAGNPQGITDANPTTSSTATGAGAGIVGTDVQIDMVELDITHTFDGDLDIVLVSPNGLTLDLSLGNGGTGDDFTSTVFQDGGGDITTAGAPFTGTFEPEGGTFAGAFAGEPMAGNWTLEVTDNFAGDDGTLNAYSITFAPLAPTTFTFCGPGTLIPADGSTSGVASSVATSTTSGIVGTTATVTSVDVDLDHTFDGDLDISLVSPGGTTLVLSAGNGGSGDDYENTVFQDGGGDITLAAAPFTGTFEPEGGPFAVAFDNEEILGDWTLNIVDNFAGDSGELFNFCVNFETNAAPAVPNDECDDALPIACDETVSGTTIDASFDNVGGGLCGTTITAPGVWYSFVSDGSTYTASTCNTADYDTKISVFTGSCGGLVCVTGNDDGIGCAGFSSETAPFTTTAGETYYILVHGFLTATGNFDLTLTCCAPPEAVCENIDIIADNNDPIVITPSDVDGGSTADCGGLSLSIDVNTFDCFDDGDNTVVLTATDMFGNTDECEATVTIINTFVASEIGCIGDINVTLGDDCSARITPGMVLTGNNVECAPNATVTVDGTNSDIITGCGEHTYVVEVGIPETTILGFDAADWTFVEDTGFGPCAGEFATATLTPTTLDLSIRYGLVVSGTYTAPFDGNVSFNYDFNGGDAFFDFLIIDANGTEILNITNAESGVINEPVMTGQTIVVRIEDDDFCGIPAGSTDVALTNFAFVSEAMDFNTCWGNINAEDKTDPEIECPDDLDAVTAAFNMQTAEGTIDATDPTIEMNNYSCYASFFETVPGAYGYDLHTITVNASDIYNIVVDGAVTDQTLISVYAGDFNPDNPCENILGGTEGAWSAFDFFGPAIANFFNNNFRIPMVLEAGREYTIMVASNDLPNDYTIAIASDNGNSVSGGGFGPAQQVDFEVTLFCDDLDAVSFFGVETYEVDGNGTVTNISDELRAVLEITGYPVVSDDCGPMLVTVSDEVESAGDCGDITVTRTFIVSDRADGACVGAPRTSSCTQTLTLSRPSLLASGANPDPEIVYPPFTAVIECDEYFETDGAVGGPDDNPTSEFAGQPFILTVSGYVPIDPVYCNLGANYSDEPRINVCGGSYKFRREWNLTNWCDPSENLVYQQYIKVADYTGPDITGVPEVINVSTSPFDCLAYVAIPNPGVEDGNGCSSASATTYTVLAFGETFFAGGDIADGDVVAAPIGEHRVVLCAEDDCGNETCITTTLVVTDEIEPTAVCDDELNVSIGGGDIANGIEGIARVFAVDFDEGSNDNCSEVTVEVRRNYWRNDTCDPSANRWSPWGEYVDFYCCDVGNEVTIELRVTDEAGNSNICWQVVTPEDKLNPFCYAPDDVELTCVDLPLAFPGNLEEAYDEDFAGTSTMMSAIFGNATGTDNCAVDTIVERTPNININECGWGTITRRFEAWQLRPEGDVNGNGAIDINEVFRSTNNCSQDIEITEVHDFVIDFPEDADADCGDPEVPTIITEADGCDVLSINIGDPVVFEATGDECYKYSITYDVINWCLWDGEYEGYVIDRQTEDDGEALPVDRAVEGNERPVVRYNDDDGLCIDRRHNDRDGDSSLDNCESPQLPNYGRYIYTQFVKVYDSTSPEVTVGEYGGPTANCPDLVAGQFGDDDGDCEEAVSIPFSVADDCELFDGDGNLVVSIVSAELDAFAVDANGDGDIKSNEFVADVDVADLITDNGDGTYSFDGTFPIITDAMGDNVVHALRVLFEDGCGNQVSEYIEFDVIDCKGPAPICINGLTVTLMPQEDGGCAMAIWASDFEGSPIFDCTGQGPATNPAGHLQVHSYAIYRAADVEADPNFVPSPDDTGLVLTQDDEETTVVYVYAFDEDGNYDYCETYVLVQQHVDCGNGTGTLNGTIATETAETVEGVEVSVNGGVATMTTTTDGTFTFALEEGGDYTVTPYLNAEPLNGVSTFDLVLMSKHILGVQLLDSPYKLIAADVNRSESITTLDLIQLRKLILNIDTEFQNNTSWRFVDASYDFPVDSNPWTEAFPEVRSENNLAGDIFGVDFVGVKIGDVNGSAQANALASDDRNLEGEFTFSLAAESLKAGNIYTVAFRGNDIETVEGFQGTLKLNGVELVDIEYGVATAEHFGLRYADQGMITTSWNGEATSEDVLFSLVVRASEDIELSEAISVNSRYTEAEAYGNGNTMNVGVIFTDGTVASAGFELYQNTPNPFQSETMISFNLPEDAEVTLTVNDAAGRVLTVVRGDYAAGYNTINLAKTQVQGATGVLSYTVTAGEFTATKTMIAVK